jgi:hypothetical protein
MPPPRFVGKVSEKQGAHRPFEADVEFADFAFGQRDHPHPGKPGRLEETGDMFLVAADTVEALREDNIDTAGAHRL